MRSYYQTLIDNHSEANLLPFERVGLWIPVWFSVQLGAALCSCSEASFVFRLSQVYDAVAWGKDPPET